MITLDIARHVWIRSGHEARKKSAAQNARTAKKYAVWIDNDDLDRLREYQQTVGVPVSESVRRAVKKYLEVLGIVNGLESGLSLAGPTGRTVHR